MKVVLLADIKNVGKKGEVKQVADGYAANMLIPKGLAKKADTTSINAALQATAAESFKHQELVKEANDKKQALQNLQLKFLLNVGEGGKAFGGGITNKEIEQELTSKGFNIERKKIEFEPAKKVGKYTAKIKLYDGIVANLVIIIDAKNNN